MKKGGKESLHCLGKKGGRARNLQDVRKKNGQPFARTEGTPPGKGGEKTAAEAAKGNRPAYAETRLFPPCARGELRQKMVRKFVWGAAKKGRIGGGTLRKKKKKGFAKREMRSPQRKRNDPLKKGGEGPVREGDLPYFEKEETRRHDNSK